MVDLSTPNEVNIVLYVSNTRLAKLSKSSV